MLMQMDNWHVVAIQIEMFLFEKKKEYFVLRKSDDCCQLRFGFNAPS